VARWVTAPLMSVKTYQKCVNSAGSQSALSKQWPKWVLEKKVQAVKAESRISFIEARKIITSENRAPPSSRGQSMAVVVRSKIAC